MRPLSPTEAFEPAFTQTRALLLRPFRPGRSWKLAFCAYLGLSGSLFIPFPLALPVHFHTTFSPVLWIAAIVATAVMGAVYYLGSRMQFVLFDLVLTRESRIAPLWRLRQPSLIWRWILLKLALTLPLAAALLLPLRSALHQLFEALPQAVSASQPSASPAAAPIDPHLLLAVVSLYAGLFAAMSVLFFANSLLSDFVLPVLALETTHLGAALRQGLRILRADPVPVLGFVGFQVLLTVAGLLAQYIVAVVLSLLAAIPLCLLAVLGYLALHTVAPPMVLVGGGILLYLVFLCLVMYLQLGTFGALMIFLRAYSLLFLAGYYPPLARSLPPASLPPPSSGVPPPPFPASSPAV